MNHTTIKWGDGFIVVEPAYPDLLLKRLKYWRISLKWDAAAMRRVAEGRYEELYQAKTWIDTDNVLQQQLITMPGFLHRIKGVLREAGWTFDIIDQRTPMPKPDIIRACAKLRDYQVECVYTAIMSGGGIVAAPTGWGKTHVMAALAEAYDPEELKLRGTPLTVVAVPDKDITLKNFQDLKEMLPHREVGLVMSGKNKFSDDLQVITLDSLHRLNPADVGVLIVDEVHTSSSDERAQSLNKFVKAVRWGVSATPDGRFDGRDLVTEGLFGPVVYKRTYQQGVKDGALVPITVYWIECPEPGIGLEKYANYTSRDGRYRQGVWRNEGRNAMIGEIMARLPKSMQCLCIMQFLDHMSRVYACCPPGTEYVHAQTSEKELAECGNIRAITAQERKDIYQRMKTAEITRMLSTYVYKQGVNFPALEVVINAGGGGSDIVAKQVPGRESRKTGTKERSFLIDFWHPWDKMKDKKGRMGPGYVHSDDQAREAAYTELGFDQVWIKDLTQLPMLQTAQAK